MEVPTVDQNLESSSVKKDQLFDPSTGEILPEIDFDSCPMPLPSTTVGGVKNRKTKGGAIGFQTDAKKNRLIDAYLLIKKGLNNLDEFKVVRDGVRVNYNTLSDAAKMEHLKNIAGVMNLFVRLLNSCTEYVKQYVQSKGGLAGGNNEQQGGSDFNLSKIYSTQGLIIDNNDPIVKASSYINTADQIPQPFSSASSGASYSSGIEPQFLQDVLPVLNMAGGVKQKLKSKRNYK